jgi:ATP/maltotriose-dependent transcriptional regulator MalT
VAVPRRRLAVTVNASQPRATINAAWLRLLPSPMGEAVLLRSWISVAGLAGRTAWVSVERDERDPQRFWLAVLGALRQAGPGSALVRGLTAAPDLDGWAIVERLLKDLAPLGDRVWLVVDDVHELGSDQALRQLELLVMRAPGELVGRRRDRPGRRACGARRDGPGRSGSVAASAGYQGGRFPALAPAAD